MGIWWLTINPWRITMYLDQRWEKQGGHYSGFHLEIYRHFPVDESQVHVYIWCHCAAYWDYTALAVIIAEPRCCIQYFRTFLERSLDAKNWSKKANPSNGQNKTWSGDAEVSRRFRVNFIKCCNYITSSGRTTGSGCFKHVWPSQWPWCSWKPCLRTGELGGSLECSRIEIYLGIFRNNPERRHPRLCWDPCPVHQPQAAQWFPRPPWCVSSLQRGHHHNGWPPMSHTALPASLRLHAKNPLTVGNDHIEVHDWSARCRLYSGVSTVAGAAQSFGAPVSPSDPVWQPAVRDWHPDPGQTLRGTATNAAKVIKRWVVGKNETCISFECV